MFIGVYLCLSGMVWLLGLFIFLQARLRMGLYSALAIALTATGLILFTLFSMALGLVRFGTPENLSIPQDYIARGAVGVGVLLVGIVGILSPVYAAWWVNRKKGNNHAEL